MNNFTIIEKVAQNNRMVVRVKNVSFIPICPNCDSQRYKIHSKSVRKVHDIAEDGVPVQLEIEVRRFKCLNCNKVITEHIHGIEFKSRMTSRLKEHIIQEADYKTNILISKEQGITEKSVRNVKQEYRSKKENSSR